MTIRAAEYYQQGQAALAFLTHEDGTAEARALFPGSRRFVTDNTLWAEVYLNSDNEAVPLERDDFDRLVESLGGKLEDLVPEEQPQSARPARVAPPGLERLEPTTLGWGEAARVGSVLGPFVRSDLLYPPALESRLRGFFNGGLPEPTESEVRVRRLVNRTRSARRTSDSRDPMLAHLNAWWHHRDDDLSHLPPLGMAIWSNPRASLRFQVTIFLVNGEVRVQMVDDPLILRGKLLFDPGAAERADVTKRI